MKNIISLLSILLLSNLGCNLSNNSLAPGESADAALKLVRNDLGNFLINTSGSAALILKNDSSADINELKVNLPSLLTYKGGKYPGTHGTCQDGLTRKSTCELLLDLRPYPLTGELTIRIPVSYTIANQRIDKELLIKANFKDEERLFVQPINFGSVDVGKIAVKPLHLENLADSKYITDLSLTLPSGSLFRIVNPAHCQTIAPRATCQLDIEFAPKIPINISSSYTITYQIAGKTLSEQVPFVAIGNAIRYLNVTGTNNINQIIKYNEEGEITITLSHNNHTDHNALSDIKIDKTILAKTTLKKSRKSTCKKATVLSGSKTCTLIFNTKSKIKKNTPLNEQLDVTYKYNDIPFIYSFTINGNLIIRPVELDITSEHNFGKAYLKLGAQKQINIVLHNPKDGSFLLPTNFATNNLGDLIFDAANSTCGVAPLNPDNTCTFALAITALANTTNNYRNNVEISYQVNGDIITLPVTVAGNLILPSPGATKYPTNNMLVISNNKPDAKKPAQIKTNQSFNLSINIANVTNNRIYDLRLEILNATGNPIGAVTKEIKVSDTSPCLTNFLTVQNAACNFDISITPNSGGMMNGNFERTLRVSYKDEAHDDHYQDFAIKAPWALATVLPYYRKVVSAPADPWPENKIIPKIIDIFTGNLLSFYQKRPIPTGVHNHDYTPTQWGMINTYHFHQYTPLTNMPWTFNLKGGTGNNSDELAVAALKDIIPDRWIDPITHKRYVVLYHGTGESQLAIFKPGSSAIGTDIADVTIYGGGFYMTTSLNKALAYGCIKHSGQKTLLLVLGIQEDEHIYAIRYRTEDPAKQHKNMFGISEGAPELNIADPKYILGAAKGDNRYEDIYCRLTDYGNNQMVCYKNILPYLRIIELRLYHRPHGQVSTWDDHNGWPEDDNTMPTWADICN